MKTTLQTAFRTAFNLVAPASFYKPSFKVGDLLIVSNVEDGIAVDLPRFGSDCRFSVLGGSILKVVSFSRGQYSSQNPSAEYEHSNLGYPHYELEVVEYGSVFDRSRLKPIALEKGSRIHIDAQIADGRLNLYS